MDKPYATAWKAIRIRRFAGLGCLAFMGIYVALWIGHVIQFDRHRFLQPYVLPIVVPLLGFVWCFDSIRCPRCGEKYHVGRGRLNWWCHVLSLRCVHCGLARNAGGPTQSPASDG